MSRPTHPVSLTVVAVLAALMLSGCGSTTSGIPKHPTIAPPSPRETPTTAAATPTPYVALGDSYAAAPGVEGTTIAGGCIRANHNYPHLLAAMLPQLRLTDVTCTGATTGNLTHPQRILQVSVPAQLDALRPTTGLVTLGIGGNDLHLFDRVLDHCLRGDSTCLGGKHVGRDIDLVGKRLTTVLHRIHRRAPHARIVLVGYPQLVPADDRGCAEMPANRTVLAEVHRLIERFGTIMKRAARRGGATYVDLLGPSAGHDVCSAQPWINGRIGHAHAVAFHPFLTEQQAVAKLVAQAVS